MALNDVPLEDAGRNYYQQQFGNRIQSIRKYGANAPAARNSGCLGTGGMAGGGFVALLVVVRIIIAVAVGVGSSGYDNSYNYSPPPTINFDPPPQVDWNNNLNDPLPDQDRFPWLHQDQPDDVNPPIFRPDDPPIFQPNDPPVFQPNDPPVIGDPNDNPPAVPGDDDKAAEKDK